MGCCIGQDIESINFLEAESRCSWFGRPTGPGCFHVSHFKSSIPRVLRPTRAGGLMYLRPRLVKHNIANPCFRAKQHQTEIVSPVPNLKFETFVLRGEVLMDRRLVELGSLIQGLKAGFSEFIAICRLLAAQTDDRGTGAFVCKPEPAWHRRSTSFRHLLETWSTRLVLLAFTWPFQPFSGHGRT